LLLLSSFIFVVSVSIIIIVVVIKIAVYCLPMMQITHWQHPRFHAYFPAGNSYPSILADMLSDAIGCVGFSWVSLFYVSCFLNSFPMYLYVTFILS